MRSVWRAALPILAVCAAAWASACASVGGGGPSGPNELLRRAGSQEVDPPRDGSEYFVVDTVLGTRERTFNAVRFTYESLGIPFSYYDADRYEMGGFVELLGEIDHEPPSTWARCGHSVPAGDNADRAYVSLALGTRVQQLDATRSTVETILRARSHQRDVSSTMVRCPTTAKLEARIAKGAQELLLKYGPSGGDAPPGG